MTALASLRRAPFSDPGAVSSTYRSRRCLVLAIGGLLYPCTQMLFWLVYLPAKSLRDRNTVVADVPIILRRCGRLEMSTKLVLLGHLAAPDNVEHAIGSGSGPPTPRKRRAGPRSVAVLPLDHPTSHQACEHRAAMSEPMDTAPSRRQIVDAGASVVVAVGSVRADGVGPNGAGHAAGTQRVGAGEISVREVHILELTDGEVTIG